MCNSAKNPAMNRAAAYVKLRDSSHGVGYVAASAEKREQPSSDFRNGEAKRDVQGSVFCASDFLPRPSGHGQQN